MIKHHLGAIAGVFLMAGAITVLAQYSPPPLGPALHVGVTNVLYDEYGNMLDGTSPDAGDYGFTPVEGELVQILVTSNGVIDAPGPDGIPTNSNNVIIHETQVGEGVDPSIGPSGMFGTAVPGRPMNKQVFARAFNKKTVSESSFYTDSQVFSVGFTFNSPFIPVMNRTTNALDGTDPDGDGLINSWEKSENANPNNPDTDGDGMPDGAEFRAGTGITNELSFLSLVQISRSVDGHALITWDSVAGRKYQVQATTNSLGDASVVYQNVSAVITAVTASTSATITNGLSDPDTFYRVGLYEQ